MLVLSGLLIIVVGFALSINPLLVVTAAGIASASAAGLGPLEVVGTLGKSFVEGRFMAVAWLALPMIGLLERSGLREHASAVVSAMRNVTAARILVGYFAFRQVTAAIGLTSAGGHVQMVRPIVAPMVEAAADRQVPVSTARRMELRAHAAAADNIGVFFGEDVFVAVGSILLIRGFMLQQGIDVAPLELALWAAPIAVAAFLIHGSRLLLLGRAWSRERTAA